MELDRRHMLVGLVWVMLTSLIIVVPSPNFAILMVTWAPLGIVIGGFWDLATAASMHLVPVSSVPKALGIMYTSVVVATVFFAPVGR